MLNRIIRKSEVEQFSFDGLLITDYTAKLDEKSSFAIISVPSQISHKLSWSNRSDKYYYVMTGEIDFVVDNKEFILSAGDLCIIKRGDRFKYINNSGKEVKMILVHTPSFKLDQEVFEDK